MVVATATSSYQNHTFFSNFLSSSPNNSNLFPLHLRWLQETVSHKFLSIFCLFSFFVRRRHGVFQRFRPIRTDSARFSASRCISQNQKKKKKDAVRHAGSSVPRASPRRTQVRRPFCRIRASQPITRRNDNENTTFLKCIRQTLCCKMFSIILAK